MIGIDTGNIKDDPVPAESLSSEGFIKDETAGQGGFEGGYPGSEPPLTRFLKWLRAVPKWV